MGKLPLFTPLESPAIYDGGVERKCSFLIPAGRMVKSTVFSNGVYHQHRYETEDMDEAPISESDQMNLNILGRKIYFHT